MNRLKSLFISLLVFTAVLIAGYSIWKYGTGGSWGWLGVTLTAVPIVLYFLNIYRYDTPRTSENLTPLTIVIDIGVLLTLYSRYQGVGEPGVVPLALLMLIGWTAYVHWYSKLKRPDAPLLAIGEKLPSVTLYDVDGRPVPTSDFAGQKALYLFYRGNWCPFCMAQIREIAGQYRQLVQRNVQVVLVSPQPQEKTAGLARKFDVPMRFLVDKDNGAARQLGIAHEHGIPAGYELLGYDAETVLPTVLLVDENGRILYADLTENYRIRPEPAQFLRILDEVETGEAGSSLTSS
jgi:peroxiredoxin